MPLADLSIAIVCLVHTTPDNDSHVSICVKPEELAVAYAEAYFKHSRVWPYNLAWCRPPGVELSGEAPLDEMKQTPTSDFTDMESVHRMWEPVVQLMRNDGHEIKCEDKVVTLTID